MDGTLAYLLGLTLLTAFSAFFSGSEAALFSLDRTQLKRLSEQSKPGRDVARALATPRRLLITILIGNLIVNVISTSAATTIAVGMFGDKGIVIAFAVMSVIILIFGEILPKVLALNRATQFAKVAIYPLRFFDVFFTPARVPIASLTDAVIGWLAKRLGGAPRYFSRDELLTAIDIGMDGGQFGKFEHDLFSNIIEFRDTIVREIMTPSINVHSLPLGLGREEMLEQMLRRRWSRVPVYGDTPDDIRGVLHMKDVALSDPQGDFDVESLLREPYLVPESTRIAELFRELGRQRGQLALVIDEFGSFVGIVTIEDILEELVGEIRDSHEPVTANYTMLDDKRIVVAGTMEIDDFNEVFDAGIIDDEVDTVAGYLLAVTGRIPGEGETIDIEGLRFHIISAEPNRVRKMRVEKLWT